QGSLAAPAAFFFAPSQGQVLSQIQFASYPHQVPPAYQVGAQLGEVSFFELRVTPVKLLAGHKAENGVTQELQLLVIYDFTAPGSFLLACSGAVGQRPEQRFRALKMVAQERFQRGYIRSFHGTPEDATAVS